MGIGVPASTPAAGSGYVAPSVVDNSLDCLETGQNCSSFVPPQKWTGIGGAMTWSINWDAWVDTANRSHHRVELC